jgi:hypothetical protein
LTLSLPDYAAAGHPVHPALLRAGSVSDHGAVGTFISGMGQHGSSCLARDTDCCDRRVVRSAVDRGHT